MKPLQKISVVSLFQGLPEEQLEKVTSIAVAKSYMRNHLIFEAGSEANGFYAIASGRVKIFRASPSGKEQIIHVFGPGEIFGEVPVFQGGSFPANAQTMDKSELLFFPRREFRRIITEDPDLAMSMMAELSQKLRALVHKIDELSLKEAPSRVAGHLLLLSASQESDTVKLEMTKGQVAFYLGTIQETLSRILKRMVDDGIIDMQGREITILDMDALEDIAAEGR